MNSQLPTVAQVLKSPALLLATWWGAGLSPRAPGTVGSLAALPFCYFWLLALPAWGVAGLGLTLLFIGVWAAKQAGKAWGKVDHGAIVIDEVLGQLLALALPFYVLDASAISLEFFWSDSYFLDCLTLPSLGRLVISIIIGSLAGE